MCHFDVVEAKLGTSVYDNQLFPCQYVLFNLK